MASRKEAKEQARLARLEQEAQRAAAKARKQRLGIFGGVIAAAVIAVVLIVSLGGSGKTHHAQGVTSGQGASTQNSLEIGLQTGASATKIGTEVDSMLSGIHQSGATLGSPNAKVTLEYFGDLQCSACQQFTLNYLPSFISSHVRTGLVKITYGSVCTASCNAYDANGVTGAWPSESAAQAAFDRQQIAAYAAGAQGKAWNYIERFYHQQGAEETAYSTEAWVTAIAGQVSGLNLSTWAQDRKNPLYSKQLQTDNQRYTNYVKLLNVSDDEAGTPFLVMVGPKGTVFVANSTTSSLISAYQKVV